ncbi:MAG: CRISPR-associated endonuclease Cas3'', partial [Anaerolineae bacterium]|nr:CRISPR-associated endonuclease Cas3'' [Anaerolineae bacterium]
MSEAIPEMLCFVGKWGQEIEGHPLVYHLIDSASFAELLWQQGLTPGARHQFCEWLQLPEDDCGRLLAFWTSLHDLGKATPSFQARHAPSKDRLSGLGFDFPLLAQKDIRHHSLLSQWILRDLREVLDIQQPRFLNLLRFAIGGHHGTFHIQEDQKEDLAKDNNLGGPRWKAARQNLTETLRKLLAPPVFVPQPMNQTTRNAFFNLLTGLFVTADWLASQDDLFQYHPHPLAPEEYWQISRQRAQDALDRTGWGGWQPDQDALTFEELFSFAPRPLQQIVIQQTQALNDPFLMIIEAPTGCGKTEAALAVADRAIRRGSLRGWYIAMPTQATSNQMFGRARNFLARCYPHQANLNLQLAHGHAQMNDEFQKMRLASVEDLEGAREGTVSAMEWFLPRKRTLLAPFGVGTVDQ